MTNGIQIKRLKGEAILPYLNDLARLRIQIFREYPYLYDGDLGYEENYLKTYASCKESIIVLVMDDNQVVGASTAIPLQFEIEEFKKPFTDHGTDIHKIFYLGESILLPAYRGKKLYSYFFHERESAALEYGCNITAFCAVERSPYDPRRPKNYEPLDKIWEHFGYVKHPELRAYLEWKEIDEESMSKKTLEFWLKNLKK